MLNMGSHIWWIMVPTMAVRLCLYSILKDFFEWYPPKPMEAFTFYNLHLWTKVTVGAKVVDHLLRFLRWSITFLSLTNGPFWEIWGTQIALQAKNLDILPDLWRLLQPKPMDRSKSGGPPVQVLEMVHYIFVTNQWPILGNLRRQIPLQPNKPQIRGGVILFHLCRSRHIRDLCYGGAKVFREVLYKLLPNAQKDNNNMSLPKSLEEDCKTFWRREDSSSSSLGRKLWRFFSTGGE